MKKPLCNRLYKNPSKRVLIKNSQGTEIRRVACKQWSCKICAPMLRKKWATFLLETLKAWDESHEWVFCTFTVQADKKRLTDPETRAQEIKASWDKLSAFWRYLTNDFFRAVCKVKGWEMPLYIRVIEAHKSGAFHIHAVFGFLPNQQILGDSNPFEKEASERQEWNFGSIFSNSELKRLKKHFSGKKYRARDWLSHAGIGYVHKWVGLGDDYVHSTWYITKYLTKVSNQITLPKSARRILVSKRFGKLNKKTTSEKWTVTDGVHGTDLFHAYERGLSIRDGDKQIEITPEHVQDTELGVYPSYELDGGDSAWSE